VTARDVVRSNDTIISLAGRLLGDPMRWREIVDLNVLRAPYIAAQRGPGVLQPGDEVVYPGATGAVVPRSIASLEADTYRRDFATLDGDLILQGGDFATTVGIENLRAALLQRIVTRLGGHPFHPLYGSLLSSHLGRPADAARLSLMIDDVLRAVLRDPRVEDATGEADYSTDIVTLTLIVTPIKPGTPFGMTVPLA
jgi:phage baseplate assembly protein W